MRVAFGFVGLLAAVVIVCILAVIVYKRAAQVESPARSTAGVTNQDVHDEIRDTVRDAFGH